ncbi:MAG: RDD family protein [Rickettsiales bacterium]|jgi:hypothetical protein|nr:RDD family protein [Rickettsiales bacterium]
MNKISHNARSHRRILSFILDVFFVNFMKSLLIQLFVLSRSKIIEIQEFMDNFKELFGKVGMAEIKDFHVRYVANNSHIFNYIFYALLIISITGIVYSFLCTALLGSSTLGQKIMSLRVTSAGSEGKPGILRLLARSILVPLPITTTLLASVFFGLSITNFHLYVPENTWQIVVLARLTALATHYYVIATLFVFFMVFWYGVYYLTDRLTFSDILSLTRIVEIDKYGAPQESGSDRDLVYFGDRIIGFLEKFNVFLFGLLKRVIGYAVSKFKGSGARDKETKE